MNIIHLGNYVSFKIYLTLKASRKQDYRTSEHPGGRHLTLWVQPLNASYVNVAGDTAAGSDGVGLKQRPLLYLAEKGSQSSFDGPNLSFVCNAFSKCLLLFSAVTLATSLVMDMVPQSSDIVLAVTKSRLNEQHTCAHTRRSLTRCYGEGWGGVTGYPGVQSYSVWYSGKYPTHTLNKGDGGREIPDMEEQILVFTGGRFTCPALLCFYSKLFQLRMLVGVSGHFHWLSLKLFALTSQLMLTAKHSCSVRRGLQVTVKCSTAGRMYAFSSLHTVL